MPTALVDLVRELARLHRAGPTKAVIDGLTQLITSFDNDQTIDIDSVSGQISKFSERLERLETEKPDINAALKCHEERLGTIEIAIEKLTQRRGYGG